MKKILMRSSLIFAAALSASGMLYAYPDATSNQFRESIQVPLENGKESRVIRLNTPDEFEDHMKNTESRVFLAICDATSRSYVFAQKYDQLSIDFPKKGIFLRVDTSQIGEVQGAYEIGALPALLVFEEGEHRGTYLGLPAILEMFSSL